MNEIFEFHTQLANLNIFIIFIFIFGLFGSLMNRMHSIPNKEWKRNGQTFSLCTLYSNLREKPN